MSALVTLGDASLYAEDLDTLRGPAWITANVVDFCFALLERQFSVPASVLLVPPATMLIVALTDDASELGEFLEPLALPARDLVLMPVNNETQRELTGPAAGTHWSLLVFDRRRDSFVHWDSMRGCNAATAEALAAKLRPVLQCTGPAPFGHERDAPQQRNGYDCGVYVCCNVERVLQAAVTGAQLAEAALVTPSVVQAKREALLREALNRRKK